jgi:transposase
MSKRAIARQENVSRWFVERWTESLDQNLTKDGRGWRKGRGRSYTLNDERRVLEIHKNLDRDPQVYFSGASAILYRYQQESPQGKSLSLRYIGRILAKHGLSKKPKVRVKGASRYLHYPAQLIDGLGESILELDFIGKKFIDGRTEPINFIGFSLTKPHRLKHFQRAESETTSEAEMHCKRFFKRFEKPEVIKIDNGFAFAGSAPQPRVLNAFTLFLLKSKIIPVFTAPRKPWNQASIEGSNSIFSRKFWHRERYSSLDMIDTRLNAFNKSYQQYLGYQSPRKSRSRQKRFIPKVYFIRKVYEDEETRKAFVEILHDRISIPRAYIGMFVLAEWNVRYGRLKVRFQSDKKPLIVKEQSFVLNHKTKITSGSFLFVT